MINPPIIRPFAPLEWPIYKNLRLRSLADTPDAFGSTLEREQSFSDSSWASRLMTHENSWDLPLVAEMDTEPVGLAWGRIEKSNPSQANLYQMWVAPNQRHLGLGKMLLDAVIAWAREKNASCLELGVTSGNNPALRLYTQAGFETIGQPEPLRPGSDLLCQPMRLKLSRPATGKAG
jgi:ribosomal protein S18 acetylase RimI-like enzyme